MWPVRTVRTVDGMGTTIHGRFDHLVLELGPLDATRLRRRRLPVPLDAIRDVHGGTFAAERTIELGSRRHPAVVLELAPGLFADRIAIHRPDAAEVVDDLRRRGVAAHALATV